MLRDVWTAGRVVLALAVAAGGMPAVQAQEAAPSGVRGGAPDALGSVPAATETTLTTLDPVTLSPGGEDVSARLSDLIRQPETKFLEEVTVLGRGRGVGAGHGTLGQIVWYGLSATVDEEQRSAGLPSPLKSAFMAEGADVDAGTPIQATGDLDALIEAARALLGDPETAQDEDADGAGDDEDKDRQDADRGRSDVGSGGGSSNEIAAAYEPLRLPREDHAVDDPQTPEYEYVTADGCSPRVVLDQGVVYAQSRMITVKDGAVIDEGPCGDSLDRFPIQRSYGGCADAVSIDAMTAHAQYRPYWVGDAGEPHYISDCQVDGDQAYEIVADGTTCAPMVDLDAGLVTRAEELVYSGRNGVRTVVRSCLPNEEKSVPVVYTAEGCGYRHDLPNNYSVRQLRPVFDDNGIQRTIGSCGDAGEPLAHVIDTSACEPLVDLDSRTVTPFARRSIETDIGRMTIVDCSPLADRMETLRTTRSGCETAFVHNVAAGQSYRTLRSYHDVSGSRAYVGDCFVDPDAAAIPHQTETVAWEHDDAARFSRLVTRTYIVADEVPFTVGDPAVLADAPEIPYVYAGATDAPDVANIYYNGCSRYTPTDRVETYARPDTSVAQYATGAGTPLGPTYACTPAGGELVYSDSYLITTYPAWRTTHRQTICRYRGRAFARREDGATLATGWYTPPAASTYGGPPATGMSAPAGNYVGALGVTVRDDDGRDDLTYSYYLVGNGGTAVALNLHGRNICHVFQSAGEATNFVNNYGIRVN